MQEVSSAVLLALLPLVFLVAAVLSALLTANSPSRRVRIYGGVLPLLISILGIGVWVGAASWGTSIDFTSVAFIALLFVGPLAALLAGLAVALWRGRRIRVPRFAAVCVVLLYLAAIAASLQITQVLEPPKAYRVACLNNIWQIGRSMILYADDHEGRYPESFGILLKEEYLTTARVFVCPASGREVPEAFRDVDFKNLDLSLLRRVDEWSDYVQVSGLTRSSPGDFILIHERYGSHEGEGTNCAFNDGSARWLLEAEFQKRMKAQEAKLREGQKKENE